MRIHKMKLVVAICCHDDKWVTDLVNKLNRVDDPSIDISAVMTVKTGSELLELCKRGKVTTLIADCIMPEMNLSDVIINLQKVKPPFTIGILHSYLEDLIADGGSVGVSQFYVNTNTSTVISAMIRYYDRMIHDRDVYLCPLNRSVYNIMNQLGVPHGCSGYVYIRDVIMLGYTNTAYIHNMSIVTYPTLAEKYSAMWGRKISPQAVERAIRTTKNSSWVRGDSELITEIFGYSYSSNKGQPTNTEYIGGIISYLKLRRQSADVNFK